MGESSAGWTRRRFLATGGKVAAGAAAAGIAGTVLWPDTYHRPDPEVETGLNPGAGPPEDLDPVALTVAMIRFNTSHNGEGGVTRPHAEWMAARWQAAGVETEIVETPKPDNVHLIARIRGTGAAAPLLFLGHSDVVGIEKERWTVDPFGGEVKDGFVYGRGALDMKGTNGATMAALLRHVAEGARFDRDVIFLSDCDEEIGPYPARWLAEKHPEKIEAGAVVTEGGWMLAQEDGTTPMLATLTCQDKVAALVEVTTAGITTHSARPQPDSAIVRLNRAVARLADYEADVVVTPLVRLHLEALAKVTDDRSLARAIDLLLGARTRQRRNRAGKVVVSRSPYPWLHYALLRPTLSFVIETGGYKTNIIPGSAKCQVNVRFLPGGPGPDQILEEMRRAVDDDEVTIRLVGSSPAETPEAAAERITKAIAAPPSVVDTDIYRAWEAAVAATYPGAAAAPTLFEAGTATGYWRAKGIPVYGVYPYVVDNETLARMHGNDERVGVEALRQASELMYQLFARFRV